MKRFSKPTLIVLAVLLAAFAGLWAIGPSWMQSSQGTVMIEGNVPGALAVAHQTGRANPNQQLELVVGLKLRNVASLNALIISQRDPLSVNFHRFITPDEFVRDFAPTVGDVDKLVRFLKSHGLTVIEVAPNRLYVRVSGTISQIDSTFGLNINTYALANRIVYSNDRNPSVPADLRDIVQGVVGLDSISVLHSHMMQSRLVSQQATQPNVPLFYGPADLATAYNFPLPFNTKPGVIYDGRGVSVAIATAYDYQDSDVQTFWKYFGIQRTGTVTNIYPNGRNSQLDGETTLDLQQLGALAPGADILMYEGHDAGFGSFVGVYNRIVTDNKASVATSSWGLCEAETAPAEISTEDNIFAEGETQGITFLAATGDDGAYDCAEKKPFLAVDFPASDPHFVAVGGTTLVLIKSTATRFLESAWSGSGGGVSTVFARPDWQFGPGVPLNDKRNLADISLNADPDTGDDTYFKGVWMNGYGGTSFASPDLAALFVDAVQANGGRLGYVDPSLYRILRSPDYDKVFYDVTTGSNDDGFGKKFPGYPAGPGYDHPTGVGSPDGRELINWLILEQEHSANPRGTPLSQAVPLTVPSGTAAH